jgi:imidazolonepropionase-like amidohydrolase
LRREPGLVEERDLSLRAQVRYGGETWRALETATYLPSKAFGVLADPGTAEPGKRADMRFVSTDPLRDVNDVSNMPIGVKNGKMYSIVELMAPLVSGRQTAS